MAKTESDDFKAHIDLEVDKHRYLIGNIRAIDVALTAPLILFGVALSFLFNIFLNIQFSGNGFIAYGLAFLPAIIMFGAVSMNAPEYERKEVKLGHRAIWQRDYNKRQKIYEYENKKISKKSDFMEDIRSKFGIYDISRECYETLDERLVKVIQVSSVNVTSLPKSDQKKIYESFETFCNKLEGRYFPFQITSKTTPISLDSYIEECREKFENNENKSDRLFGESYLNFANDIQKNKKMVSKSPYVIISRKKNKKEDTYEVLEELAERLVSDIENMLPNQNRLTAKILNNEELFKLFHYSIDYLNANVSVIDLDQSRPITFTKEENNMFDEYWKEKEKTTIM